MRLFLGSICLIFSLTLFADTKVATRIHHLDVGINESDETLVYLSTGLVARVYAADKDLIERFKEARDKKTWFNLTLSDTRHVLAVESIPSPIKEKEIAAPSVEGFMSYNPSVVSADFARRMFYESMQSPHESQCYNRAHVWTHEWRIKHNVYSNKIFIFFTQKYIRQYAFEWWFHVSPYMNVIEDGQIKERVMDVKYGNGLMTFRNWTNIFMRDGAKCPNINSFSEYANFPESGTCFTMRTTMYTYQPIDLEVMELNGTQKLSWIESELREAYREAFDIAI